MRKLYPKSVLILAALVLSGELVGGPVRYTANYWPEKLELERTQLPYSGWTMSTRGRGAKGSIDWRAVSKVGDAQAEYDDIAGGGAFSLYHTHETPPFDAHTSTGKCDARWDWSFGYHFDADANASATMQIVGHFAGRFMVDDAVLWVLELPLNMTSLACGSADKPQEYPSGPQKLPTSRKESGTWKRAAYLTANVYGLYAKVAVRGGVVVRGDVDGKVKGTLTPN
jgi:hypothetical protein